MLAFINCPLAHQLDEYFSRSDSSIVDVRPEIYDALMNRRPVVALESTIITHGMPHPHNFETAIEVEKIVREQVIECGAPLWEMMNCRRTLCALHNNGLLFKLTVLIRQLNAHFVLI